ncbi:hypothetical protein GS597_08195 [Synechococcales cyanobacterium C]|uniref:Uncharacterized protein n=1 Tax=Petrachloros mirabilis ULC683 TaxID=2781853 RepID=A0A8K1ZYI1_9CYAN|nr:hypothetical protein [Petrachloros mirabilis]NCJ06492.1 hypothetical protein [Petrachloros mirabilis ULC683]
MQSFPWHLGLLAPAFALILGTSPTAQISTLSEDDPPPPVQASTLSQNMLPMNSNPASPRLIANYQNYQSVIAQTVNMVRDPIAQNLAQRLGLNILNITWEDTGRYKGSAVGPNISDMTIQVQQRNPVNQRYELSLMPVIRHPNFADESADIPLDQFFLLVGNEKGQPLQRVTLRDFLGDLRRYLHSPGSWSGRQTSLLAQRDTHALVSAQACFLPIPQQGKADFNPVLFNYQSYKDNPAVLTILATREGTSVTVIDNQRDGFEAGQTWGQRLFFNKNGQRASLTGQRLSDFQGGQAPTGDRPGGETSADEGLNMVLLIQVPLKQKELPRSLSYEMTDAMPTMAAPAAKQRSDVEAAVIGHGAVEGPFTEIDNLGIERDPRFPIRVTVQFYKATSNGVVSNQDMEEIHQQIARVYADADYTGSLVVSGDTGRPTEYDGSKQEPPGWWADFWQRHEQNTGQSREEALEMLRRLRGEAWMPQNPQELRRELRNLQP